MSALLYHHLMADPADSYYTYATPYGALTIADDGSGIYALEFGQVAFPGEPRPTKASNDAANQLQGFLAGKRTSFDVPLSLKGTQFQKEVWQQASLIPYGETRTPAQIARALGIPTAYRKIGAALRQCSLMPLLPIHRIVLENATGKRADLARAFRAIEAKNNEALPPLHQ